MSYKDGHALGVIMLISYSVWHIGEVVTFVWIIHNKIALQRQHSCSFALIIVAVLFYTPIFFVAAAAAHSSVAAEHLLDG